MEATRTQRGTLQLEAHWSVYKKGKPYAARLTGLDAKYGFAREFLRQDSAAGYTSRSGRTGEQVYRVWEPGVYEVQSSGRHGPEREYWVVEETEQGLRGRRISAAEARALVS